MNGENDTDNLTDEQFTEMVEAQCSPARKRIEELERENARLREVGQRLRDKLAFELECIGDSGNRDIAEWDLLLPNDQGMPHDRAAE